MRVRSLFVSLVLCGSAAFAQKVNFTASSILNGIGTPAAPASFCVQPVTNAGVPLSAAAFGGGGQMTTEEECVTITGRALPAGYQLADTSLTIPLNLCYDVKVRNNFRQVIYEQTCVQPSNATANSGAQAYWCSTVSGVTACNYNLYNPNLQAQVEATNGPAGPVGPTGATGATGPTGPAGATGPTGPAAVAHGDYSLTTATYTTLPPNSFPINQTLVSAGATISGITVSTDVFTCSTNPVFNILDCGTSTSCSGGSVMASATITGMGTMAATVSNPTLTAAHYIALRAFSGGFTAFHAAAVVSY